MISRAVVANAVATDGDTGLLDEEGLPAFLQKRGIGEVVSDIEVLGGGISNTVLGATVDGRRVVVKQALPKLRVVDEWLAEQARAVTEAEALRLCGSLTPGFVPEVIDIDVTRCAMVLERAPAGWDMWKNALMAGDAEPRVAATVGRVVGSWHSATADGSLPARFRSGESFRQLRTDPYHRTAAARRPELAARLHAAADAMASRRRCLVHGDLSPKNVLVGPDGVWIIDAEVAHLGDPAFDVAFMWTHLVMKAVHLPNHAAEFRACTTVFDAAYVEAAGAVAAPSADIALQLGALLVARVDGKSPAEYLRAHERERVRSIGAALLNDPSAGHADVWELSAGPGW